MAYTIEEAIKLSKNGLALGLDAAGQISFTAQGPEAGRSRRNHRKKFGNATVWLNWPDNRIGKRRMRQLVDLWIWQPHVPKRLKQLPVGLRSQLDTLTWVPASPIDVVEHLASL